MNREIKFRGKTIHSGEWVVGDLLYQYWIKNDEFAETSIRCLINGMYSFPIPVIKESVGQYIGLKDKNKNEIYEGDIICNDKYQTWEWRGVVKFSHGVFGVEWLIHIEHQSMAGTWGQKHNLRRLDDDIIETQVVIGNIYENPELLEEPK